MINDSVSYAVVVLSSAAVGQYIAALAGILLAAFLIRKVRKVSE